MHRNGWTWIPSLLALFLAMDGGAALAGGEVTVLATGVTGDYGTGVDTNAEWMTLRYAVGNDFQFRADVSMIRADLFGSGVTSTGLGLMRRGGNGSQSETQVGDGASSNSTSGLGDIRLAVSRRVFGGGVKVFRVDAGAEVKIPTADEDSHLGTGQWDYRLVVASEYRFWSTSVFGGVGWNRLGDTAAVALDDVLDAYVGLDSNPFAGDRLIATGWLEGWQAAIDTAGHRAAVGVGIRTTGKRRLRLQVRTGLTDATEDLAVVAGVSFGVSPSGPAARGHQR